jgi:hypothetical protein
LATPAFRPKLSRTERLSSPTSFVPNVFRPQRLSSQDIGESAFALVPHHNRCTIRSKPKWMLRCSGVCRD